MSIVAGIDFGTLSVRASIFDRERGRLSTATADYPVQRRADDPHHATQRPQDHWLALQKALPEALAQAGLKGPEVAALAIATTGSTIVPVDARLQPVDDYYLWCDHRAHAEAAEITAAAKKFGLPGLDWCGGIYSAEMGWAKWLHWLRHHPEDRDRAVTVLEHVDFLVAHLTGVSDVRHLRRSVCAAGHKWMWQKSWGGWPDAAFWRQVDPLLTPARTQLPGTCHTSDELAGHLCAAWAEKLGLRAGIPIPVGGLDAHWDAIGAGITEGDVVNVVGTSACIMAMVRETRPIPGVFGVVPGSIHPDFVGIEAGLSAVGEIFEAIARRAGRPLAELSQGLENYAAGQTGLLRLDWDHGDRNILANPALGGVTLGWHLQHTAQDELFAAIEGAALHSRIILERLAEYGVPVRRLLHAGGIPQRNEALNQVYANVLAKPVLVPTQTITGLGSGLFAFLAAGDFPDVASAQRALGATCRTVAPQPAAVTVYEQLFALYRRLYFALGQTTATPAVLGDVLPALTSVRSQT